MAGFGSKFNSKKQDWTTPRTLFDKLNNEFHFEWDLAASKENALCSNYYTKELNGLNQEWLSASCFINPPFGDSGSKLSDWVKKAYVSTQANINLKVVMLIPARTNTKW